MTGCYLDGEYREIPCRYNKKEILFFDELDFGWVVDREIIEKIHASCKDEDIIFQRNLDDLFAGE